MSAVSRRYACTAGHLCFSHPTSLSREYGRTREIQADASTSFSCSTDEEEQFYANEEEEDNCEAENNGSLNGDSCASAATLLDHTDTTQARAGNDNFIHDNGSFFVNNQPAARVGNSAVTNDTAEQEDKELLLQRQVELVATLTGKVALLQVQIRAMARANRKLQVALRATNRAGTTSYTSNDGFKHEVTEAINNVLKRHTRWGSKRTGALVAQAVWAQGGTKPELLKLSRKHFRDHVLLHTVQCLKRDGSGRRDSLLRKH